MFNKRYKELVGDKGAIRKWLEECRYTDKRYGVKLGEDFKIVTGAFEEDHELQQLPIPINIDDYTIVDIQNQVQEGINAMDKAIDMVNKRGMGEHSIRTGVILNLYKKGQLEYMNKFIISTLAITVAKRISSSLSLDEMDRSLVHEVFTLYFIRRVLDVDDNLLVFDTYIKDRQITDDEVNEYFNKYESDFTSALKFLTNLDVSKRLKMLKEEIVYGLVAGISFMGMSNYMFVSMVKPAYILSVIYTTMKNPFYKKSYLYTILNSNKKMLDLDTNIKNIEHIYKDHL